MVWLGGRKRGEVTEGMTRGQTEKNSLSHALEFVLYSHGQRESLTWLRMGLTVIWASLISQLVKNPLQCRRPWLNCWVRKIRWRRDRLPTPVFLGFPCGSAGKEFACNEGELDSILGFGKIPWRRERLLIPVFWPGEFRGPYSPWDHNKSDTTEQLSLLTETGLQNQAKPRSCGWFSAFLLLVSPEILDLGAKPCPSCF